MRSIGYVLFLLALILAAALFLQSVRRTTIPQRQLITQLQRGNHHIALVWPKGDHFDLVIGVPKGHTVPDLRVAGQLLLRTGTNLLMSLTFETQNCSKANWLEDEHLDGYVLTLPSNESPKHLQSQPKEGASVDIQMEITDLSSDTASLWLTYLARWADVKKWNNPR
jgi:hypothetical protein